MTTTAGYSRGLPHQLLQKPLLNQGYFLLKYHITDAQLFGTVYMVMSLTFYYNYSLLQLQSVTITIYYNYGLLQ